MTVRDPSFLSPGVPHPPDTERSVEWVERKIGDLILQLQLEVFHNKTTEEWFVRVEVWNQWDEYLVDYFIRNSIRGPAIENFLHNYAIGR